MNMKNILRSAVLVFSTLSSVVQSLVIPNADTPLFYLVSTSASSPNLLPLLMPVGGGPGVATFLGSSTPALFYFWQGQLTVYDLNGNASPYQPSVNSMQDANGCEDFGQLVFVHGPTSNKCAKYSSFQIQSDGENSHLGAELVFNYVGGFWSCNGGQEVWYKVSDSEGPAGCTSVHLYTVPAYQY